jgi:hypothetical protein
MTVPFQFEDDFEELRPPTVKAVAYIGYVANKRELLERLATQLSFPDYFGFNWDSLYEVLRDFSWIGNGDVAIVHHELPNSLGPEVLRTYLELLKDAVETWQSRATRRLLVAFPQTVKETVVNLLRDL